MRERAVPPNLIYLAGLVGLAIATALVAGTILYRETLQAKRTQADAIARGDWRRGETAIGRYGCGGCHVIAGISGAVGKVGPSLEQVGKRTTVAGSLPNDPETMVRWLRYPQHLRPGSAMPEQPMSERDARDIAAFLYSEN